MKKQGYNYHYHLAQHKWLTMNLNCWNKKYPGQYLDPTEQQYIEEHFDEMEQVKIVWDGKHYLKIKWENWSCWWANCCDHSAFYYCVMLNIDDVNLKEPAKIFK